MEYLIGVALGLVVGATGAVVGFDRERGFYPVVLIVIAFYYVLFATIDGSARVIGVEIALALGFSLFSVLGFRKNLWFTAGATVGHGIFDSFHGMIVHNAGMPVWWPGFCGTIDVVIGVVFAAQLVRGRAAK